MFHNNPSRHFQIADLILWENGAKFKYNPPARTRSWFRNGPVRCSSAVWPQPSQGCWPASGRRWWPPCRIFTGDPDPENGASRRTRRTGGETWKKENLTKKAIKTITPNESPGPDVIPMILLCKCSDVISFLLDFYGTIYQKWNIYDFNERWH